MILKTLRVAGPCRHNHRVAMHVVAVYVVTICCGMLFPDSLLSTASCQDVGDQPEMAVSIMPAGVQRFANEGWASLSVVGVNPTDTDSEEIVSVFLNDDPKLQFSTKFWIPARSKRQTWLPILIPPFEAIGADRVNVAMMRVVESEGSEAFDDNLNGMPLAERSLMLANDEINSGLFAGPPDLDGTGPNEIQRNELNSVINAGRDVNIRSSLDLPSINFTSNFLPPTHDALDEMDQVVIAGDHLRSDTGGMIALRRWLRKGGRVWIMLDLTDDALVTELLGDDASYTVVDRVELNDFQLESIEELTGDTTATVDSWASEVPVDMMRVFADDDEVTCRIEGWPIAFWKRVGDGEVLFTTLGARGWLKTDGTASIALNRTSRRFFEPRNQSTEFNGALIPIVDNKIGYQVPSRRLAGAVLGLNALVILVAGAWWARRRQLERMAFLVPVSAIITTGVMLWIGRDHAESVPSTVATSQVVQVRSATDEADISTVRAIYSQDTGQLGLVSNNRTLTMPNASEGTSETKRVRFDDSGKSRWFGPDQPPGVLRHLSSDSSVQLARPIQVRGTFDANGFRGTLFGIDAQKCEDGVIINVPGPVSAVELRDAADSTSQLVADTSDLLAPDQFVPGALLSDDQRIRQEFLQRVFESPENNSLGSGLSLLCWTEPVDLGVRFADRFERKGSALVSIPIQIDRPSVGSDFLVPATFVRTEAFAGKRGRSALFNPRTGEWLSSLTKSTETELLFRFPKSLASMTLNQVDVSIKLNAPSRSLVIKAMVDGEPKTVYQQKNPTGLVQFTIEDKDALRFHAGGLWLEIGITESDGATELRAERQPESTVQVPGAGTAQVPRLQASKRIVDNTTWQIDYIHLDAKGRIESGDMASNVEPSQEGKP